MITNDSLSSFNSIHSYNSTGSKDLSDKNSEKDDEEIPTFHKYKKIGTLIDRENIKESICTKHYDENGNKYYNEYKFITFLGSGTFSKIELVEKDGIKYAMKIIDKEFLQSQRNMEFDEDGNLIINDSFENALKEIAILKKTNHPNIIRLYEIMYCKKNKKIYLILEYCENGDLMYYDKDNNKFTINKYFKRFKKRDEKYRDYYSNTDISKFLENIISGLYYLHSNGIIHRDIKPNNLLLDKDNICKITDFNVSTILDNLKDDNIGKKIQIADHFRPPESCYMFLNEEKIKENNINEKGKDYKGRPIDIWSLGVTAYILAYNKFPFDSANNNLIELYSKISKAEYEFPEYPKRDKNIKNIIQECLEKDPNKRMSIFRLHQLTFLKPPYHSAPFHDYDYNEIRIFKKDIINSINFFCPNCIAVFDSTRDCIKMKIDTGKIKYKEFKGKIKNITYKEKLPDSFEEKYGVFFVDEFIFRKEDFGMISYRKNKEARKKDKLEKCKNYKKYSLAEKKPETLIK